MKKSELRKLIREEVKHLLTEAKAQVIDSEYVASNGKPPKGTGNWAFRLENNRNGKDGDIFWPSSGGKGIMPFKKALQLAQQEAANQGASFIFVLP